jgi:hypothetical protein
MMSEPNLGDIEQLAALVLAETEELSRSLPKLLSQLRDWESQEAGLKRDDLGALFRRLERRLKWLLRMRRAIAEIDELASTTELSDAVAMIDHLEQQAVDYELAIPLTRSKTGIASFTNESGHDEVGQLSIFYSFIDTTDVEVANRYSDALRRLLDLADYELLVEGQDEWTTWWKRWVARARKSDAPKKLAQGVAQATADTYMRQPGAAATRDLAEAARAALDAIGQNEGCQVFDNLIVGKVRTPDGGFQIFSKELSLYERRILHEQPGLISHPADILAQLEARVAELKQSSFEPDSLEAGPTNTESAE